MRSLEIIILDNMNVIYNKDTNTFYFPIEFIDRIIQKLGFDLEDSVEIKYIIEALKGLDKELKSIKE